MKVVSSKVGGQVAMVVDARLSGSFSIDKKSLKVHFWVSN
jgi:hypothetical protein